MVREGDHPTRGRDGLRSLLEEAPCPLLRGRVLERQGQGVQLSGETEKSLAHKSEPVSLQVDTVARTLLGPPGRMYVSDGQGSRVQGGQAHGKGSGVLNHSPDTILVLKALEELVKGQHHSRDGRERVAPRHSSGRSGEEVKRVGQAAGQLLQSHCLPSCQQMERGRSRWS